VLLAVKADGKIVDLVVDPDKATAIEFAAELICDGGSLGDACKVLNERGDRTMAGNTWATSVLHRTLASPHLIGHRLQKGVMFSDDDGNPVQVHDAVIPAALWHRVNRTLSQRSSSKSPRRRGTNRPKSLVGSLLKCAECGSGFTQNCKENGNHYYRCHTCRVPTHSIRLDLADAHIARSALNFLSSLDADSAIIGEVGRRCLARFSPEQLGRHEAIQEELGLLRNKAAELQIAYFERSTMEHDVYERLEQRFTGQIERLESELHTTPRPTGLVRRRDGGDYVRWVQHHLARHGFKVIVDGVFGRATERALRSFQRRSGLIAVFDDAIARDAAFGGAGEPTLTEEMFCYLLSNELQYYNGSAWQPAVGLNPTATGTFSGATSFSVNNCFTSTWANYRIVIAVTDITSSGTITMRLRASSSDDSTSNYDYQFEEAKQTTLSLATSMGASSFRITYSYGTPGDAMLVIDLTNPQATEMTQVQGRGSTVNGTTHVLRDPTDGYFRTTTAFDGFSILQGSNIAGSYAVYGYGD
jgi:peptidoglycan hydrolase-like protein with peptidoglycan-binding domain